MVALNSHGEVADILDVNQFQAGRSAYECVAYSGALCTYAGQPGHGATGSALQASNLAQFWYGKEEGSNLSSNTNGMSLQAEYDMLKGMGLTFHEVTPDVGSVKSWLQRGYPVMLCGGETGMVDMELGRVPYSWTPTGNHCIVASGIAPDGNLLVHDCANIGPNGVRTGPRTYDASKLHVVSATAIDMPWIGGNMAPQGWKDDGTTLTAPNNVPVVHGFRLKVLAGWDAANWPLAAEGGSDRLEDSNPALGGGTQQIFRWSMLGWTKDRGVFEEWLGVELAFARQQIAKYYTAASQAQAQVAQLQAQLAQLQQSNPDALNAIHQVQTLLASFK